MFMDLAVREYGFFQNCLMYTLGKKEDMFSACTEKISKRQNKNNYINQTDLPKSPGTKSPIKEYTEVTYGSRCICSRGWPYPVSLGGEPLGPVEV